MDSLVDLLEQIHGNKLYFALPNHLPGWSFPRQPVAPRKTVYCSVSRGILPASIPRTRLSSGTGIFFLFSATTGTGLSLSAASDTSARWLFRKNPAPSQWRCGNIISGAFPIPLSYPQIPVCREGRTYSFCMLPPGLVERLTPADSRSWHKLFQRNKRDSRNGIHQVKARKQRDWERPVRMGEKGSAERLVVDKIHRFAGQIIEPVKSLSSASITSSRRGFSTLMTVSNRSRRPS